MKRRKARREARASAGLEGLLKRLLALAGLGARSAIQCRGEPVGLRIVRARANEDIRWLGVAAVIGPVPVIGDMDHGAIEIQAAVNALGAGEGDEVRGHIGVCACAYRARGDAGITTDLD